MTQLRDQAVWNVQRLIAFKRTLQADLTAHVGYPQPVVTLRGVSFPNGLKTATADALAAVTPYGSISIPWTDLAPKTILQMANYFISVTTDPKGAADRRWLAAVYALENGSPAEARALAGQAARERPDYQKELGRFNG